MTVRTPEEEARLLKKALDSNPNDRNLLIASGIKEEDLPPEPKAKNYLSSKFINSVKYIFKNVTSSNFTPQSLPRNKKNVGSKEKS